MAFALLASGVEAQSLKEQYELSERCGKLAAERFEKDWGDRGIYKTDARERIGKYENHYNYRLNKCFYLEVSDTYERDKAPVRMMALLDLHENREIASYSRREGREFMVCLVEEKYCQSEKEWLALIKPFMED